MSTDDFKNMNDVEDLEKLNIALESAINIAKRCGSSTKESIEIAFIMVEFITGVNPRALWDVCKLINDTKSTVEKMASKNDQALKAIKKAEGKGIPANLIYQHQPFKGWSPIEREDVLKALLSSGQISKDKVRAGKRGPGTMVYRCLESY